MSTASNVQPSIVPAGSVLYPAFVGQDPRTFLEQLQQARMLSMSNQFRALVFDKIGPASLPEVNGAYYDLLPEMSEAEVSAQIPNYEFGSESDLCARLVQLFGYALVPNTMYFQVGTAFNLFFLPEVLVVLQFEDDAMSAHAMSREATRRWAANNAVKTRVFAAC